MQRFLFSLLIVVLVNLGLAYRTYAQEKIAFSSDREGNYEIYTVNPSGSNLKQITNHTGDDIQPSWSSDGRSLVFCSDRDGDWEIYTMKTDGSSLRQLTSNSDSDRGPTWSPDGRSIAFHSYRDGNWELYVMNSDGSNQRNITNSSATQTYPSWSPDNQFLIYNYYDWQKGDNNWEVYKIRVDGSNPMALTSNPGVDQHAAWSPDGQSIAFWSERDGDWNIYLMNSNGSDQKKISITSPQPGIQSHVAWSPDSRFIAFPSFHDIYKMNADGSDQGNLTNNDSNDFYPAWTGAIPGGILTILTPVLGTIGAQSNWGAGCPKNKAPTFTKVVATRTTLPFGRNEGRNDGVVDLPGFTSAFFALILPPTITLDGNGDGKYDGQDPIVLAAANIPSYCTLLVAEGITDPDGDPMVFRWEKPKTGSYYSTGGPGSSFAAGQKITDLDQYNRNSIIWEPTSLLFPVLDHNLMGSSTSLGFFVEDDPSARNQPFCPRLRKKKSKSRYSQLNYGDIIHLELELLDRQTIPNTHPDPDYRGGIEVNFFAQIIGNYEAATETTFRVECGNYDDTLFDQSGATNGGVLQCQYKRNEVGNMVTITTVGSSFGPRNRNNPYVHPVDNIPFTMETFYSKGGTIGDTLTTTLDQDVGRLSIQLWDSGALKDDAFALYIDGIYKGETPPGSSNLFFIDDLLSGLHEMEIRVKLAPDDIGTYTVRLFNEATFSDGTDIKTGGPREGTVITLEFIIP